MAYKIIRVYDGSDWLQVGAQVPGVVDSSGTGSIVLDGGGGGSTSIAFGGTVYTFAPYVFVQVTGINHATAAVTADTVGFTADFKGTAGDTITFSWFAVQVDFS